jgi:hypothetical protein
MKKSIFYNSVCKKCQNIFIGLKKDMFGCFRIQENETKTMKQV